MRQKTMVSAVFIAAATLGGCGLAGDKVLSHETTIGDQLEYLLKNNTTIGLADVNCPEALILKEGATVTCTGRTATGNVTIITTSLGRDPSATGNIVASTSGNTIRYEVTPTS